MMCEALIIRVHFILFFFWLIAPLTANQLDEDALLVGLPEQARSVLKSDSIAFRYDRSGSGLKLAPSHPSLDTIRQLNLNLQPDVMVEGLYFIPYSSGNQRYRYQPLQHH